MALQAALPTFWQVSSEAEFLQGEVENLAIDSYGRLTLGPAVSTVYESSAPFLWTLVSAPDGSVVRRQRQRGPGYPRRRQRPRQRLLRHRRARGPRDRARAWRRHLRRHIPGRQDLQGQRGRVRDGVLRSAGPIRLEPRGRSTGNVYAGTGDKGTIYKIGADGRGAAFYQTKATHVMSLAFDREGRLLAGTESPGRVFQIDASGKPFVLLDSPYNEIRTLRVDAKGNIYAAAVSGRGAAPDPPATPWRRNRAPQPIASVSTEVTSITIVADASAVCRRTDAAGAATRQPRPGQRGRVPHPA